MRPKIAILACDALRKEIDTITSDDKWVVSKEYLEFGLHLTPPELRDVILDKLSQLEGKVDAVFLGYGICQALKDVPSMAKVPLAMIETEDCIAALLTPDRYHDEKDNNGITWFYPAGWAEYGMQGITQLFHLDSVDDERYPPEFFLDLLFDGFKRCLFIDTGMDGSERCYSNSELLASKLGLRHESTNGTLDLIREAWERTRTIAQQKAEAAGTMMSSNEVRPTDSIKADTIDG
ncbi:MAG: DUF1638 domain-containing protein [Methanomassiliicoccales archaeon]|nr:DUF1638 domain-containing protein [Methanomassiliicoccales archaeon]